MYYRQLESNHVEYEAGKDARGKPTTVAVNGAERKARYDAAMKANAVKRRADQRDRTPGLRTL